MTFTDLSEKEEAVSPAPSSSYSSYASEKELLDELNLLKKQLQAKEDRLKEQDLKLVKSQERLKEISNLKMMLQDKDKQLEQRKKSSKKKRNNSQRWFKVELP
ncbi:Hypothetical protein FKW44_011440 [Caligus rogercresseyi]|uniref:Uncharacterized protein n=1 Tax=Caligus rogercresseyi TaxID=217165 RepID=A0A7T8HI09_CALRO|nr:Hypothetical protein FKW44_011440 [Caligus rogercresseyi]